MSVRLRGEGRAAGGVLTVAFSLSPSLLIRDLQIGGVLRARLGARAVEALERAIEGAPLDAERLTHAAKRAFQEAHLDVGGVGPEDLVRALLAAQ